MIKTAARFIAALVVVAVVGIGVPWTLWALVQWPLPTTIPTIQDITETLKTNDPQTVSATTTAVFALIAWIAWAYLAWAFITELVAAIRDVPTRSANLARRAVRPIATSLIWASSTASTFTAGISIAAAEPPPLEISAPVFDTTPTTQTETLDDTPLISVINGDTLWDIAETHLGDPFRYPEIVELTNANLPAGQSEICDPDIIDIGMTLRLPTDATGERLYTQQTAPQTNAATELADEPDWAPPKADTSTQTELAATQPKADTSTQTELTATQPTDDTSIQTELAATQPTAVVVDEPDWVPPKADARIEVEAVSDLSLDVRNSRVLALTVVGGVIASALGFSIWRLKKYVMATRRPGTVPTPSSDADVKLEQAIDDATNDTEWVRSALASLEPTQPVSAAPPTLSKCDPNVLEVAFDGPTHLNHPWELINTAADDSTSIWAVKRENLDNHTSDRCIIPTMVSVGRDLSDETYLLHLETGILSITGEPDHVHDLCRAIAFEMASQTLDVDVRVLTPIDGLPTWPTPIEDVSIELQLWWADLTAAFTETNINNAMEWRALNDDWLTPMVLIIDAPQLDAHPAIAAAAADPRSPIAVIATAEPTTTEPKWRIDIEHTNTALLHPYRIQIQPNQLDTNTAHQLVELRDRLTSPEHYNPGHLLPATNPDNQTGIDLPDDTINTDMLDDISVIDLGNETGIDLPDDTINTDMLDDASVIDLGNETGIDLPDDTTEPPSTNDVNAATIDEHPVADLRLDLLGEISMVGADGQQLRPQPLAIVTYLMLNGPATRPTIADKIWGGQGVSPKRVSNVIGELRRALGRDRLPEISGGAGRYQLRHITSDLAEFETFVDQARSCGNQAEQIILLAKALRLVKGVPLTRNSEGPWKWMTHYELVLEATVVDVAVELCELLMANNQWDEAIEAANSILVFFPIAQPLIEIQVAAYKHLGQSHTAKRVVEDWEEQVSALGVGDPSDRPRELLTS